MQEQNKVRVGTTADVDAVMELATRGYEEMGYSNVSAAKVLQEVWSALSLNKGCCGLIGEPGGVIKAGVLLRIGSPWYSDDAIVEERGIFVHPDYRKPDFKSGNKKYGFAAQLCDFSKKFADDLGLPLLVGIQSSHRIEPKIRLYERVFGEQKGAIFVYNMKKDSVTSKEH